MVRSVCVGGRSMSAWKTLWLPLLVLLALVAGMPAQTVPLPASPVPALPTSSTPLACAPVDSIPLAEPGVRATPITLASALQLAGARSLDVQLADARVKAAMARLEQANYLWLPTIYLGIDYFRHDGQIQDVVGRVFGTSKSALLAGAGPVAFFATADAVFGPLASRQAVRASEADRQAACHDTLLAVAESYLNVQQARGDLAGALLAAGRTDELLG